MGILYLVVDVARFFSCWCLYFVHDDVVVDFVHGGGGDVACSDVIGGDGG